MKILVIGGLGTLGSRLVEELRNRKHDVWISDKGNFDDSRYMRCNIDEFRQVENLFSPNSFDYVYHLAAEFGRRNGEDFYESLWKTNSIGTKNIIRMQERLKFRMVFTSSSEVYGDYRGIITEDVMDKAPIRQNGDYAISKWVNEIQIMNSAQRFGTETVRVRLFNNYGPGERYSEYRSAICAFVYKALHNLPYTVYTEHKRTFTYVDDTVRTLANIAERFKSGEVYNIGGEEVHNMKQVSDLILAYVGRDDSLVEYRDLEEATTLEKILDISKAKREIGHRNTVRLEEGLARVIEWQKEVYGCK